MDLALRGISVLVVEDDTDTRELLRILFQTEGGLVTATASVQEALSAYDRSRPDVIVADIGMPEHNGYTLIGRDRARDRKRGQVTPAIALTPYATSSDRDPGLSAGFQVPMTKPIQHNNMVSSI